MGPTSDLIVSFVKNRGAGLVYHLSSLPVAFLGSQAPLFSSTNQWEFGTSMTVTKYRSNLYRSKLYYTYIYMLKIYKSKWDQKVTKHWSKIDQKVTKSGPPRSQQDPSPISTALCVSPVPAETAETTGAPQTSTCSLGATRESRCVEIPLIKMEMSEAKQNWRTIQNRYILISHQVTICSSGFRYVQMFPLCLFNNQAPGRCRAHLPAIRASGNMAA